MFIIFFTIFDKLEYNMMLYLPSFIESVVTVAEHETAKTISYLFYIRFTPF